MSHRSIPLSLAMKLIVLVALNLALLRTGPFIPQSPPFLFALVALDLVVVQSVILGWPLRAFHYAFLVFGFLASSALTAWAFFNAPPGRAGSLRIVETLVRAFQDASGNPSRKLDSAEGELLGVAERCVTSTLGLLPAWAVAFWVARRQRRRGPGPDHQGRRLARFLQGALIGLAVLVVVFSVSDALGPGPPAPHTAASRARRLVLAFVPLAVGTVTSLLKDRRGSERPAGPP